MSSDHSSLAATSSSSISEASPMKEVDEADVNHFFDPDKDRALAFHEAGHAVVAHVLGAKIFYVEIDLDTGNGWSRSNEFDDNIKNVAVCVAGCGAEHAFGAPTRRPTNEGDFREMRRLLSLFPEAGRRAARAGGYRLADETLKANADGVRRIADELVERGWSSADAKVRIEGDELAVLLATLL